MTRAALSAALAGSGWSSAKTSTIVDVSSSHVATGPSSECWLSKYRVSGNQIASSAYGTFATDVQGSVLHNHLLYPFLRKQATRFARDREDEGVPAILHGG